MALQLKKRAVLEKLHVAVKNADNLKTKMELYNSGLDSNQDLSVVDNRSTEDKMNDKAFSDKLRNDLYLLMNNDPKQSEILIEVLKTSQIEPQSVNAVMPEMNSRFKGKLFSGSIVANTMMQLVNLFEENGIVSNTSKGARNRYEINQIEWKQMSTIIQNNQDSLPALTPLPQAIEKLRSLSMYTQILAGPKDASFDYIGFEKSEVKSYMSNKIDSSLAQIDLILKNKNNKRTMPMYFRNLFSNFRLSAYNEIMVYGTKSKKVKKVYNPKTPKSIGKKTVARTTNKTLRETARNLNRDAYDLVE